MISPKRLSLILCIFIFFLLIFVYYSIINNNHSANKLLGEIARIKPISKDRNIAIYFVPHADDEVLTFGIPILNDLALRKNVYLILLSAGERSISREVVNGRYDLESSHHNIERKFCKIHHRYHNPLLEGYIPLTIYTFGQERIKEFYRAASALGINKSQVMIYHLPNDQFKSKDVNSIISRWVNLFPNATFNSMSSIDVHPDHAEIGKVLNILYQKKEIIYKRNFVSIATLYKNRKKHFKSIYLKNKHDKKRLLIAIQVYKKWNPRLDEFALGYHSVPSQFNYLIKKLKSVEISY